MTMRSRVVRQFRRPSGVAGWLAGSIMAHRPSNRRRNEWTIDLLDLEPTDRVLELGCGPGLALQACARQLREGHLVGVDHSPVMVRQARRRLACEIRSGRAEVRLGGIDDLVADDCRYDRIYSVNVIQFLPDMDVWFDLARQHLSGRGRVATTYQPRSSRPTREQATAMAMQIEASMARAGFTAVERHELPLAPVPAISVIGRAPRR